MGFITFYDTVAFYLFQRHIYIVQMISISVLVYVPMAYEIISLGECCRVTILLL